MPLTLPTARTATEQTAHRLIREFERQEPLNTVTLRGAFVIYALRRIRDGQYQRKAALCAQRIAAVALADQKPERHYWTFAYLACQPLTFVTDRLGRHLRPVIENLSKVYTLAIQDPPPLRDELATALRDAVEPVAIKTDALERLSIDELYAVRAAYHQLLLAVGL